MVVDERYLRIRRSLEEKLGVEEASFLMDRPIGGWSELVTNHTLDLEFDTLDERFRGLDERFRGLDERFEVVDERFRAIDARFDALGAQLEALEHRLLAEIERRARVQTWSLVTAMVAALGAFGVLVRL